jgi:hypothetical protein
MPPVMTLHTWWVAGSARAPSAANAMVATGTRIVTRQQQHAALGAAAPRYLAADQGGRVTLLGNSDNLRRGARAV